MSRRWSLRVYCVRRKSRSPILSPYSPRCRTVLHAFRNRTSCPHADVYTARNTYSYAYDHVTRLNVPFPTHAVLSTEITRMSSGSVFNSNRTVSHFLFSLWSRCTSFSFKCGITVNTDLNYELRQARYTQVWLKQTTERFSAHRKIFVHEQCQSTSCVVITAGTHAT